MYALTALGQPGRAVLPSGGGAGLGVSGVRDGKAYD